MGPLNRITIVCCALIALPALSAPTTRPTTTASDVSNRAAALVSQGQAALRAGDAQAALENFFDARSFWTRQGVHTDINDPLMYADITGIGTAYLALGRNVEAVEPLDRAYASKLRDRSLIVNRAILDYIQHVNIQRGMNELVTLFEKLDAPADEPTINVLGACVQYSTLDPNLTRGRLFEKASELYAKLNANLESARPAQRRWGPTWVSPSTFKTKSDQLAKGKAAYQQALQDRDAADAALAAATADLNATLRRVGSRRSAFQQQQVDNAQAKMDQAASLYEARRQAVPVVRKAIPWPEWPRTFPPLLPDSIGGGVYGAPGTPALVAVTPVVVKETPVAVARNPVPKAVETPKPPAVMPVIPRTVSRYAVAVPIGPQLLLSAAAPFDGATDLMLEDSQGAIVKATLVRKDAATGLALLRVEAAQFRYLNLAGSFTGGEITCWGFPDVSVFNPVPERMLGTAIAPKKDKWTISLQRHPRLAGAPLLNKAGELVGIELGERETAMAHVPAVQLDDLRKFLSDDAPASACANPEPDAVWRVTASREIQ